MNCYKCDYSIKKYNVTNFYIFIPNIYKIKNIRFFYISRINLKKYIFCNTNLIL